MSADRDGGKANSAPRCRIRDARNPTPPVLARKRDEEIFRPAIPKPAEIGRTRFALRLLQNTFRD